MTSKSLTVALQVATCIGCACTDEKACTGGCHWERLDRAAQIGVCSSCTEYIGRWDAGNRKYTPLANRRIASRKYYTENKSAWREKYSVARKAKRNRAKQKRGIQC